jgi:hypothetical protein
MKGESTFNFQSPNKKFIFIKKIYIQIVVFWVTWPCNLITDVSEEHHVDPQGRSSSLKMKTIRSSETLVTLQKSTVHSQQSNVSEERITFIFRVVSP